MLQYKTCPRVTSCRSENALSYVIDRIGPQGVFASDFPHEIAMEDALREINEIL